MMAGLRIACFHCERPLGPDHRCEAWDIPAITARVRRRTGLQRIQALAELWSRSSSPSPAAFRGAMKEIAELARQVRHKRATPSPEPA